MSDVVSVSAETMKLLGDISSKITSTIGPVLPTNDPKTVQESHVAGVAARAGANAKALDDESVYTAVREIAISVAYERATNRRLRSRLECLACARSRSVAKAAHVKTGLPEGLV